MRSTKFPAVVATVALLAAACSSGGVPSAVVSSRPHTLADTPGKIATAGADGFHLLEADSTSLASPDVGDVVTQPTWSRDGSRVIMSTRSRGVSKTAVIDGATGEVLASVESERPYFFFSWSHDGTRIAALGPGAVGTTLDLLDSDGNLVADSLASGGSVYVAWEPDGADLLVHSDDDLSLITPDLTISSLGTVGRFFLAPSWVPATRDVLVVMPSPSDARLVRLDVDARRDDPKVEPLADLGSTRGVASVVVDPSGNLAALLHTGPGGSPAQDATITTSHRPSGSGMVVAVDRRVRIPTAAVEMVDLANGSRTPITDQVPLWGEWSPDGRNLLVATFDPATRQGMWSTWDGRRLTRLTGFLPTTTFLRRYLLFSDQYVEQPRLWAPDGTAFTYAARNGSNDDAVFIMGLDPTAGPIELDAASVGFWSPG